MTDRQALLRALPSVDAVLAQPAVAAAALVAGQRLVTDTARRVLQAARAAILDSAGEMDGSPGALAEQVAASVFGLIHGGAKPVINATGVIVHTNLGRAPLATSAVQAAAEAAAGYSSLEFDLATGGRGSRDSGLRDVLCALTGAEDGFAVNNCASALLLALAALCAGREAVVSRGQLVEIGGGFRVPDVMRQSGATLVEVGTTNRTRRSDYVDAIGPATAALVRVHRSNFRLVGFTEEPSLDDLAGVAAAGGVALIDDVGSGCLAPLTPFGLAHEPTVQESVRACADVVVFSGDKLLGGPQAGIIVGKAAAVQRLRRHPLARAVRIDKMTLAALRATLLHFLVGDHLEHVPVWRMISAPASHLRARAAALADAVRGEVVPSRSAVGGGSLPGEEQESWAVALAPRSGAVDALAARLRGGSPAVVGRIADDRLLLDLRTVFPEQDQALASAVSAALAG